MSHAVLVVTVKKWLIGVYIPKLLQD